MIFSDHASFIHVTRLSNSFGKPVNIMCDPHLIPFCLGLMTGRSDDLFHDLPRSDRSLPSLVHSTRSSRPCMATKAIHLASRLPRIETLAPRATPRAYTASRTLISPARAAMTSPKTELVYFSDTYQTSCEASRQLRAGGGSRGRRGRALRRRFDRTVAYPGAAAPPSDTGRIVGPGGVPFAVASVASTTARDYLGELEEEGAAPFNADDEVTVTVDADKRHCARIPRGAPPGRRHDQHRLRPDVMVPAKGLPQPDQACVEYTGKVEGLDKDKLMADLKRRWLNSSVSGVGPRRR